jgi:F-box interacting protein
MKPKSDYFNQIVSSCRGFIFSHRRSSYYLWNPSTGVHKQIPLSPLDSNLDAKYSCFPYGFRYDQSTDDYLVVSVYSDTSLALGIMFSRLKFFTLRSNTWKELEATRTTYMIVTNQFKVCMFFNGSIHWLARRRDLFMDVVIAFDLMERKPFDMPFPDCFDHEPRD